MNTFEYWLEELREGMRFEDVLIQVEQALQEEIGSDSSRFTVCPCKRSVCLEGRCILCLSQDLVNISSHFEERKS